MKKPIFSPIKIHIKDLRADAFLGVYAWEKKQARPIILNLEITLSDDRSCYSDQVLHTLDYDAVAHVIRAYLETHAHELIEHLAQKLIEKILTFPLVQEVYLEIDKPGAIAGATSVSVVRDGRKAI